MNFSVCSTTCMNNNIFIFTNIFLDSDYLLNLGIDLPLITNLIIQLNLKGYHLDTSINDIDDLVEAIGGELHG